MNVINWKSNPSAFADQPRGMNFSAAPLMQ
jgi:hypothetical protein